MTVALLILGLQSSNFGKQIFFQRSTNDIKIGPSVEKMLNMNYMKAFHLLSVLNFAGTQAEIGESSKGGHAKLCVTAFRV